MWRGSCSLRLKRLRFVLAEYRTAVSVSLTLVCMLLMLVLYKTVLVPPVHLRSPACSAYGWTDAPPATRRVWDTTVINIELDMLEARLNELDSAVDSFIIVESELTFSGKRKPLHFAEDLATHPQRWRTFAPRLVHLALRETDYPLGLRSEAGNDPAVAHARKAFQKNQILRGLQTSGAEPDDLVIFSDLDEVPRASVIRQLRHCDGFDTPLRLSTMPFMYDFGCVDARPWTRASVARYRDLKLECSWGDLLLPSRVCIQWLREPLDLLFFFRNLQTIENAGWHMSYFLSLDDISTKVSSNAHTERDLEINHNKDYMQCMIRECLHFNREDFGVRVEDPARSIDAPAWIVQRAHANDPLWSRLFPMKSSLPRSTIDCLRVSE